MFLQRIYDRSVKSILGDLEKPEKGDIVGTDLISVLSECGYRTSSYPLLARGPGVMRGRNGRALVRSRLQGQVGCRSPSSVTAFALEVLKLSSSSFKTGLSLDRRAHPSSTIEHGCGRAPRAEGFRR